MLELKFHPDVKIDIKESYHWYEKQSKGLGDDFLRELEQAYQAIISLPDTWPNFHKDFKRYLLSKFPFSVIYRRSGEVIYVVTVMHNSRKPQYWHNRA